jgi:hypothetical protein
VVVLAEHVDFGGRLFIAVPGSSPLTNVADLVTAVTTLVTTITALPDTALFSVLLTQFGPGGLVSTALTSTSGRALFFVAADAVRTLYDYRWSGDWFWAETPADRISSMAILGPPGRGIACFNAPDFNTDEGEIRVFASMGLMTTVRDLHSAAPPCDPPGNVNVTHTPRGGNIGHGITTFGDEMHSIRFL